MKFIYFANPSCFACWPSGFYCLTHSLHIQAYMPLKSYFEYLGVPHLMRNPVQEGGRELNQAWGMGLGLGSGSSHSWQLGNLTRPRLATLRPSRYSSILRNGVDGDA